MHLETEYESSNCEHDLYFKRTIFMEAPILIKKIKSFVKRLVVHNILGIFHVLLENILPQSFRMMLKAVKEMELKRVGGKSK